MALIARDAVLTREIPSTLSSITHFSPDGRRMVQVGQDESHHFVLHLTDLMTGTEIASRRVAQPDKPDDFALLQIRDLAADGTRALCMGLGQGLEIRELQTGTVVTRLTDGPADKAQAALSFRAQFSPDGKQVAAVRAAAGGTELVVWQVAKPTAMRVVARQPGAEPKADLFTEPAAFKALRFAPDGARLSFATADGKTVRILDLATEPPSATEFTAPGPVRATAWHPTAPALALIVDTPEGRARAVLWDVPGKQVRTTLGADLPNADRFDTPFLSVGISLAFRPDGRWLAVSSPADPSVRVFDPEDGAEAFRSQAA